jgi:hypothetical protein
VTDRRPRPRARRSGIGLHRESTGFFYYRTTLTTGIADGQFYFGDLGDRFVSGDWGVVDDEDAPGLLRASNTTFYFRHTLTQGNADSQFAPDSRRLQPQLATRSCLLCRVVLWACAVGYRSRFRIVWIVPASSDRS